MERNSNYRQEFINELKKRCETIDEAIFNKTYEEVVTKKLEVQYSNFLIRMGSIPEKVKEKGFELFCAAYNYNLALSETVAS